MRGGREDLRDPRAEARPAGPGRGGSGRPGLQFPRRRPPCGDTSASPRPFYLRSASPGVRRADRRARRPPPRGACCPRLGVAPLPPGRPDPRRAARRLPRFPIAQSARPAAASSRRLPFLNDRLRSAGGRKKPNSFLNYLAIFAKF